MNTLNEILRLLPLLLISVTMNVGAGLYYNIGTKKMNFKFNYLLNGLVKASVIAGMFIGLAICFNETDLSSLGVTPVFIITSAITLYVSKALVSLGKILGIEVKTK